MMFSSKDFSSKCDQIRSFLQIWSHLLKKYLMRNLIFCAVLCSSGILSFIICVYYLVHCMKYKLFASLENCLRLNLILNSFPEVYAPKRIKWFTLNVLVYFWFIWQHLFVHFCVIMNEIHGRILFL